MNCGRSCPVSMVMWRNGVHTLGVSVHNSEFNRFKLLFGLVWQSLCLRDSGCFMCIHLYVLCVF